MLELDDDFDFIKWWWLCELFHAKKFNPYDKSFWADCSKIFAGWGQIPLSNDEKNIQNSLTNKPFLTVKTYTYLAKQLPTCCKYTWMYE